MAVPKRLHSVSDQRRTAPSLISVLALLVLFGATAADTSQSLPSGDPAHAMRTGVPRLLSMKSAASWKSWRGPSLLAFYGRGKQSMGLKQLGREYQGKLPIGGIRPDDVELQELFGVKKHELPTILVMQNGSPSMRLGGGSNPTTLRTLINSAIGSYSRNSRPPPPTTASPTPVKVAAAAMKQRCEKRKGVCILLATSLATPPATVELLTSSLQGQNVVHVDSNDRQVGSLIKSAGLADAGGAVPDAAVLVVKGARSASSAPRIARYRGALDDRPGLARFFEELQAGLLQFETFRWPTRPTRTDAADGAEEPTPRQRAQQQQRRSSGEQDSGGGDGHGQEEQAAQQESATVKHSTATAQYAVEAPAIEEITLQDDE